MIDKIVSALTTMGLEQVVIGMEATGIYGDNLVYALREDGALGRFQRKIHVLNPKQVSKFKESYPELPKNDDVDAFVIADKLRFGRITKEVYMDDYRYKALQTLTRFCASRENGDTSCGGTDPAWRHGKGRGIFYAAPSLGLPVHLMVSLLLRTDVL